MGYVLYLSVVVGGDIFFTHKQALMIAGRTVFSTEKHSLTKL